jgi:transglutaminase-like putative cysteine protease
VSLPGDTAFELSGVIEDPGTHEPQLSDEPAWPVSDLPADSLVYLLASRYCETDQLATRAWQLFGHLPHGASRVRAIVDYVHNHLTFGYKFARPTRTALEAHNERVGVCRDFAHLTITMCRCLNIPARYVNGYLGDIGVAKDPAPMDFSAWVEVFLGGRWFTLDARHNTPRIGRVVIAGGRDAADMPIVHSFGPHSLNEFTVVTEEVETIPTSAQLAA